MKSRFSYGLDLGSNTLRGVVFDCKSDEFLYTHESIVRTADGLSKTSKVSKEAIDRIILAINRAKELISYTPLTIKAVATEAIRVATNQKEALDAIRDATGISFEVIDGYEEARFTMEAIRYRLSKLKLNSSRVLAVDIGGGSTEISIYNSGFFDAKSFKIGILRLSQEYESISMLKEALPTRMRDLEEFISSIDKDFINSATVVATAGTPTTIVALKEGMDYDSYDAKRVNGKILSIDDIDRVYKKLQSLSTTQLTKAVGKGREDLIPIGVEILLQIYKLLNRDNLVVIDDGLREGVAIELCRG